MKTKIISLLVVVVLLFSNISYAVILESEEFQTSASEIFSKEVTIKLNDGTEESTITTTIPDSVVVNDKTITVTTDELIVPVNYVIEENKITFNMENSLIEEGVQEDEQSPTLAILMYMILYEEYIYKSIISVADAMGLDIDLIMSYFQQEMGNADIIEEGDDSIGYAKTSSQIDILSYEMQYNLTEGTIEASYEIDLERMSQIEENDITGSITATVSFSDVPTTGNTGNEGNENTGDENEESDNAEDNEEEVTTPEEDTNNNTQTEMPKTGIKYETVYALVGVIIACLAVGYKVYKTK